MLDKPLHTFFVIINCNILWNSFSLETDCVLRHRSKKLQCDVLNSNIQCCTLTPECSDKDHVVVFVTSVDTGRQQSIVRMWPCNTIWCPPPPPPPPPPHTHTHTHTKKNLTKIGLDNSLISGGIKPLPDTMLIYVRSMGCWSIHLRTI